MNLGDILTTRQIVPELAAKNRWEAIDELIGCLVAAGKVLFLRLNDGGTTLQGFVD